VGANSGDLGQRGCNTRFRPKRMHPLSSFPHCPPSPPSPPCPPGGSMRAPAFQGKPWQPRRPEACPTQSRGPIAPRTPVCSSVCARVCVCVCVCVCLSLSLQFVFRYLTYIRIYVFTYINTHTHTHTHTHMQEKRHTSRSRSQRLREVWGVGW